MTDPFPRGGQGARSSSSRDGRVGGPGDLRESLLKARVAKLPHLPAIAPHAMQASPRDADEQDERDKEDDDQNGDTLGSLGMFSAPKAGARRARMGIQQAMSLEEEFGPLSADDCFQEALEVEMKTSEDVVDTFRVYYTPARRKRKGQVNASSSSTSSINEGATPLSSGGVHVNLEIDEDQEEDEDVDGKDSAGTVFLLHHGAGYSALSFALVAKSITQQTNGTAGVLAYDCRGHGRTTHTNAQASRQLSLEKLTQDGLHILQKLFPSGSRQPKLVLVGHSMGGTVVVSMAHALSERAAATASASFSLDQPPTPKVAGVAVLDVVEGTAMDALPGMKMIVSQMPLGFNSVPEAIRWHVDSGAIVNVQSARRSVPSLLRETNMADELLGTPSSKSAEAEPMEELLEAPSDYGQAAPNPHDLDKSFKYVWRHDLLSTEPFWPEWFHGLSKAFLSVKCARLLLLAGTDRLDKELMIGQMQGKYQLVVFPDVGHSLQEDAPQKTAETLIEFWKRNEIINIPAFKGLRKVGQS